MLFRAADLPALKANAQTPEGKLIVARLQAALKANPEKLGCGAGFNAAANGVMYQMSGDKAYAEKARVIVQECIDDKITHYNRKMWNANYKWIIRAPQVAGVAYAYDLCYDAWPADFREKVAGELDNKSAEMVRGGGEGWNGSPQSNWNAITRGSGGIAALAVMGDKGAPNAAKNLEDCSRLVLQWANDIDSDGQGGEGEGYTDYALCHGALTFADAYFEALNTHILSEKTRQALVTGYVLKGVVGKDKLRWPNYGPYDIEPKVDFFRNGSWLLLTDLAPERLKPAIAWSFLKRFGVEGDQTFDVNASDGLSNPQMAAVALRVLTPKLKAVDPATVMEKNAEGTAFGHYLMRNGWKDSDDLVASIWFKARQPGGWSQLDTGSFRIIGLGTAWAAKVLPTSNDGRGDSKWSLENVVLVQGMKGEGRGQPSTGKRVAWTPRKDGGGVATGDMSSVYGMGHTRSFAVDYSGIAGVPGLYAVADVFENAVTGTWQMHSRTEKASAQGNTFTLAGTNGATLVGTVIAPANAKVTADRGEISVEGTSKSFLVVMTLQARGAAPKTMGEGAKVTVGAQTVTLSDDGVLLLDK